VWRPDSWITREESSETLFPPVEGSYVPWAAGPRVCPGKKFSQVEFVAVISSLLRDHRVRPVLMKGESEKNASERLFESHPGLILPGCAQDETSREAEGKMGEEAEGVILSN
jgi:cytochrome P450